MALVYGTWTAGIPTGNLTVVPGKYVRVAFSSPYEGYNARIKDFGSEFLALDSARAYLMKRSVERGQVANPWRYITDVSTDKRWVEIYLGYGYSVWLDERDFDRVNRFRWHMNQSGKKRKRYSATKNPNGKGKLLMHSLLTGFHRTDHRNLDTLDNRRDNLRLTTAKLNSLNHGRSLANTSGRTGVFIADGQYCMAYWNTTDGTHETKQYSITKHGFDEAWRMAVTLREAKEAEYGYDYHPEPPTRSGCLGTCDIPEMSRNYPTPRPSQKRKADTDAATDDQPLTKVPRIDATA